MKVLAAYVQSSYRKVVCTTESSLVSKAKNHKLHAVIAKWQTWNACVHQHTLFGLRVPLTKKSLHATQASPHNKHLSFITKLKHLRPPTDTRLGSTTPLPTHSSTTAFAPEHNCSMNVSCKSPRIYTHIMVVMLHSVCSHWRHKG